jgi:4-hydroxy-tetrahydrodipicolinate synthase
MKDSSGDFGNTKAMLDAFAGAGFHVFVGSERFLLGGMRGGGAGCISATANVNPGAIDRLFREWKSPDAERLQTELNAVRGAVEKVPVIPGLKAIMAHHAADPGWLSVRPPLVELAAAQREALVADLAALKFAVPDLRG